MPVVVQTFRSMQYLSNIELCKFHTLFVMSYQFVPGLIALWHEDLDMYWNIRRMLLAGAQFARVSSVLTALRHGRPMIVVMWLPK